MQQKTQEILTIFNQIAAIPRCSKHEEKISAWLAQWAANHSFGCQVEQTGTLVIQVPPTPGYENAPTVVLQGHMDMVCEKLPGLQHDFSQDPIRPVVDGDWLKAQGTTLGADNGTALALGLALASDPAVAHPPLELLFTTDEESGMSGAKQLAPGLVSGRILVNLDSEEEGVFIVGCAGGLTTHLRLPVEFSTLPDEYISLFVRVSGLQGGHSGLDIHKHRGNAIRLLGRILYRFQSLASFRLIDLRGGTAHNAIPRDAWAVIACRAADLPRLEAEIATFEHLIRREYATTEKSLAMALERHNPGAAPSTSLSEDETEKIIALLSALPNGTAHMSAEVEGFVETSSNLAVVEFDNNSLHIVTSQRSTVPSRLEEITGQIVCIANLAGASVLHADEY
ncbi:MAG TPA: beta-Ala-His dipeptidase, partial [Anaerolineales bacterium]